MKIENTLVKELLTAAVDARHFNLKYDVIDKIMSLFTHEPKQSDDVKFEKLIFLQKRINEVKHELGVDEANDLIQKVIDQLTEYLNKNKNFMEEALENIKLLSDIQKEKVKMLEHVFQIKDDE